MWRGSYAYVSLPSISLRVTVQRFFFAVKRSGFYLILFHSVVMYLFVCYCVYCVIDYVTFCLFTRATSSLVIFFVCHSLPGVHMRRRKKSPVFSTVFAYIVFCFFTIAPDSCIFAHLSVFFRVHF